MLTFDRVHKGLCPGAELGLQLIIMHGRTNRVIRWLATTIEAHTQLCTTITTRHAWHAIASTQMSQQLTACTTYASSSSSWSRNSSLSCWLDREGYFLRTVSHTPR